MRVIIISYQQHTPVYNSQCTKEKERCIIIIEVSDNKLKKKFTESQNQESKNKFKANLRDSLTTQRNQNPQSQLKALNQTNKEKKNCPHSTWYPDHLIHLHFLLPSSFLVFFLLSCFFFLFFPVIKKRKRLIEREERHTERREW